MFGNSKNMIKSLNKDYKIISSKLSNKAYNLFEIKYKTLKNVERIFPAENILSHCFRWFSISDFYMETNLIQIIDNVEIISKKDFKILKKELINDLIEKLYKFHDVIEKGEKLQKEKQLVENLSKTSFIENEILSKEEQKEFLFNKKIMEFIEKNNKWNKIKIKEQEIIDYECEEIK